MMKYSNSPNAYINAQDLEIELVKATSYGDALNALREAPSIEIQTWIPCSEMSPEEDGEYLITLDFEWGREIEIGLYADGEWLNDNRHVNIAWMPMIEPWKGADDDDN